MSLQLAVPRKPYHLARASIHQDLPGVEGVKV